MATSLPLLVFPQAKRIAPPRGNGFPSITPHVPGHGTQVVRLGAQLTALQQEFDRYKANISGSVAGLEPETVLVIEIAGSVNEFRQAVEVTGLEWLGEWDVDDIPPDEDFFERNTKGEPTGKSVKVRMFLSLGNEAGMRELLSLWEQWKNNQTLPTGKTKWRDVFNQMVKIRRWGMEETLRETGMLDLWRDLLDPINPVQPIRCQIELFYRKPRERREQAERNVVALLEAAGGRMLGSFIDMPEIAFHAVKAELPARSIRQLLSDLDSDTHDTDIQLFNFHGVMYFRPTGQSLATTQDGGVETEIPEGLVELPPVAAILDGAPNVQHQALKGRLLFDDPDNLSAQYQPGERKHGTAMASLVVHGEIVDGQSNPLSRLVYMLPIMQPDPQSDPKNRSEHIPDEVFFEDRIARAVKRMFEGEGAVPPQAPDVCVINLSIGDPTRPLIHTPSPWARLLDWLSWKYLSSYSAFGPKTATDSGIPDAEKCSRSFTASRLITVFVFAATAEKPFYNTPPSPRHDHPIRPWFRPDYHRDRRLCRQPDQARTHPQPRTRRTRGSLNVNNKPWTAAEDAKLRRLYPHHSKAEVARRLGRSEVAVRTRARKLGIAQPPRLWSAVDQDNLRWLYPDTDNTVLAVMFNRTVGAIQHQAHWLGLHKSREYLRDYSRRLVAEREARGITPGRFHAGQTPWNKGKRGWNAPGTERTRFKPGNRPHNWRPIGTEEVHDDGYVYRKVTDEGPARYHCRPVHVLVWEEAHGPVPAGHAIVFRDSFDKTQNITLDRLECITRAELMARNTVHRYPPDIRDAITMKARLTRVINEKTKAMEPNP